MLGTTLQAGRASRENILRLIGNNQQMKVPYGTTPIIPGRENALDALFPKHNFIFISCGNPCFQLFNLFARLGVAAIRLHGVPSVVTPCDICAVLK